MTGLFVATLDTGGISYSSREYVAIAETDAAARQAIFEVWRRDPGRNRDLHLTTHGELNDYYGIRVVGPVEVGRGALVDE